MEQALMFQLKGRLKEKRVEGRGKMEVGGKSRAE